MPLWWAHTNQLCYDIKLNLFASVVPFLTRKLHYHQWDFWHPTTDILRQDICSQWRHQPHHCRPYTDFWLEGFLCGFSCYSSVFIPSLCMSHWTPVNSVKTVWHMIISHCITAPRKVMNTATIARDQPNSRFHGCDIFREIGLLPWKTPISGFQWFFVNFNAFTFIYEGFQSFINSFCADFAVCYVSHFSTK